MDRIKRILEDRLKRIVLVLIALQPVLDVFSYFLAETGSNAISTMLRFGMLAAVALLGFVLSDTKRVYLILYAAAGLFWLAHMLNCFRIGYNSLFSDVNNMLRTLNFPIFALTFITVLTKKPELRRHFYAGVAIAFGEIILFTALPWLSGHPVYTYKPPIQLGVLGWFATPSAQSAILVLTVPFFIYWAYASRKFMVYLVSLVLSLGILFVTGTKLDFFSIFIISGAYIFLFAVQMGKKSVKYVLPLVVLLGLVVVFRSQSPMAARDRMTAYSQALYGDMVENSVESGGDGDLDDGEVEESDKEVKRVPPLEKQRQKVRQTLMGVYTDEDVYGKFMEDLNERFGVYNVMEAFHYTTETYLLSDTRFRKNNYAAMMWNEKDTLTRFLGFEYSDFLAGDGIYDLENDFPAVYYTMGYLGFALYMAFLAVFVAQILWAFAGEVDRGVRLAKAGGKKGILAGAEGFWRGLKGFLTVEMGAVGISFLLAVIAAQISGNVLRRPNVTIYFAIAAACIFSLTSEIAGPELKRMPQKRKIKASHRPVT